MSSDWTGTGTNSPVAPQAVSSGAAPAHLTQEGEELKVRDIMDAFSDSFRVSPRPTTQTAAAPAHAAQATTTPQGSSGSFAAFSDSFGVFPRSTDTELATPAHRTQAGEELKDRNIMDAFSDSFGLRARSTTGAAPASPVQTPDVPRTFEQRILRLQEQLVSRLDENNLAAAAINFLHTPDTPGGVTIIGFTTNSIYIQQTLSIRGGPTWEDVISLDRRSGIAGLRLPEDRNYFVPPRDTNPAIEQTIDRVIQLAEQAVAAEQLTVLQAHAPSTASQPVERQTDHGQGASVDGEVPTGSTDTALAGPAHLTQEVEQLEAEGIRSTFSDSSLINSSERTSPTANPVAPQATTAASRPMGSFGPSSPFVASSDSFRVSPGSTDVVLAGHAQLTQEVEPLKARDIMADFSDSFRFPAGSTTDAAPAFPVQTPDVPHTFEQRILRLQEQLVSRLDENNVAAAAINFLYTPDTPGGVTVIGFDTSSIYIQQTLSIRGGHTWKDLISLDRRSGIAGLTLPENRNYFVPPNDTNPAIEQTMDRVIQLAEQAVAAEQLTVLQAPAPNTASQPVERQTDHGQGASAHRGEAPELVPVAGARPPAPPSGYTPTPEAQQGPAAPRPPSRRSVSMPPTTTSIRTPRPH